MGAGGAFTKVALTGTPGTGKSTAAKWLAQLPDWGRVGGEVIEVSDLALRFGCGDPLPDQPAVTEVDMECMAGRLRSENPTHPMVIVGHLAHLLPVDRILLLRCDPPRLERRLRERGDSPKAIQQNVESELTDLILMEALGSGLPIYEHDASVEDPATIARWVLKVLVGREAPSHGSIDWLRGNLAVFQPGGA